MGIADKIKELRERRGLTQMQLAKLCGVSYQSVQHWEKAGSAPKRTRLEKVASVLGVSVTDLLQDTPHPDMRPEARELIEDLTHLAASGKLEDQDIDLLKGLLGRLSKAEPVKVPTERESDWIIGGAVRKPRKRKDGTQ